MIYHVDYEGMVSTYMNKLILYETLGSTVILTLVYVYIFIYYYYLLICYTYFHSTLCGPNPGY